jgi:hypothetical protein
MVFEEGPHARTALFADGLRAFVAVRPNPDGTWTYTLGKMSPFVPFPILSLYDRLNAREGIGADPDRWGGSNTIGGSPRQRASRVPPAELERIVNETLSSAR